MYINLKQMSIKHNVSFIVRDASTFKVSQIHTGHNSATNSLLTGVAHYLIGDGVLNQGWHMLEQYVPKYISLGTAGLLNQLSDETNLPSGIGVVPGDEISRFSDYMAQCPGYGADGYDSNLNNGRLFLGLGPDFVNRVDKSTTVNCELVSSTYPRANISYRQIIPEIQAELPETIDVVFSAMISTGALAQFRPAGQDYIYITEAGLWSTSEIESGVDNGLLAGYRITPPNELNWGMSAEDVTDTAAIYYLNNKGIVDPTTEQISQIKPEVATNNRNILKQQILRVGINQVVQVVWKIQIGSIQQLTSMYTNCETSKLQWIII